MALSFSQRLGLTLWGATTDPYNRAQRQDAHVKLDDLVAIDRQGPHNDRPAPSAANRGLYWTSTDTSNAGVTFRSDGTTWRAVNGPRKTILPLHLTTVGQFAATTSVGSEGGYVRERHVPPPGDPGFAGNNLGGVGPTLIGVYVSHDGDLGASAGINMRRRLHNGPSQAVIPEWPTITVIRATNQYLPVVSNRIPLNIGDRLSFEVVGTTGGNVVNLSVTALLEYSVP